MLCTSVCQSQQTNTEFQKDAIEALLALPAQMERAFGLEQYIKDLSEQFAYKQHALFLGRGDQYPLAMEGALKLKEISYIHAEAYPAGELKHGPLALIDEDMPVIALAPESEIAEKLVSNLEEVKARGGTLYVFADPSVNMDVKNGALITMPKCDFLLTPIVYTVPLQILSYEVALLRGTDIDQPRNLAKSVTVE
jgi:glucosamine--fructose-6-phosphate aminotransferase (isomerizing)